MATRAAASCRASIARALGGHRLKGGAARFLCRATTTTATRTSSFPAKLSPLAFMRTKQTQSHQHRSHNNTNTNTNAHPSAGEPSSSSMAASPTIHLEVERKFMPTPTSIAHLLNAAAGALTDTNMDGDGGARSFQSLVPLQQPGSGDDGHTSSFEDVYFDTPEETLGRAGVWLRCRSRSAQPQQQQQQQQQQRQLEAKVRVGGDYVNSAFEEVTDPARISALLAELVPGAELAGLQQPNGQDGGEPRATGGGIGEVARLVTRRRTFLVDGRFTVVLDTTDFGHAVGEVELEREVSPSAAGAEGEEEAHDGGFDRAAVVEEMDREIDAFMKSYPWAFPAGKPVGKLSAYFAVYPIKKKQS